MSVLSLLNILVGCGLQSVQRTLSIFEQRYSAMTNGCNGAEVTPVAQNAA